MKLRKGSFFLSLLLAFILGGGVMFGGMHFYEKGIIGDTVKVSASEYKQYTQVVQRYGKLEQLYEMLDSSYYKDVNTDNLLTGAYKGLVAGLGDPYSAYMTKDEYESWSASATGEFDGIGITFSMDRDKQLIVISTIDESPAAKAGMKPGDIILKIDNKKYTDMELAGSAMRGKAGTEVKIEYSRDKEMKTAVLTREKIVNKTVKSKMLDGNIGYIEITSFESKTGSDFKAALTSMEKKKVKGVIIDLRDNGGGIVDSGLDVADALLGKGVITYLQDRSGKKEYQNSDASATKLPYALLVNEGTASSSEIVAAAIKDEGKKNIVGQKTFGKGVVQSTSAFKDGSALKLTIMQYFSPKGNTINGKGVTPDYVVKNKKDGKEDAQLKRAIQLLK